jgi:hypothetical protein
MFFESKSQIYFWGTYFLNNNIDTVLSIPNKTRIRNSMKNLLRGRPTKPLQVGLGSRPAGKKIVVADFSGGFLFMRRS